MPKARNRPGEGRAPERDPRPTGVVPGRPYQYKRAPTALTLDDDTLKRLMLCAQRQMKLGEAAGFLGCARDTLKAFLAHHEEAQEVWSLGKSRGKATLRGRYFEMALVDPSMMRHAAKHYLGMDDKETVDVTTKGEVRITTSVSEAKARIAELMAKMGLTIDSESGGVRAMKDVTPTAPFKGITKTK